MASAVVRDTIKQRSCHLGIAKHRDPFSELEVCGDDDAGRFIQLADQMKQECSTSTILSGRDNHLGRF